MLLLEVLIGVFQGRITLKVMLCSLLGRLFGLSKLRVE